MTSFNLFSNSQTKLQTTFVFLNNIILFLMIQKIEKLAQFSFDQSSPPQNQAILQSCYSNLQNLKKFVNQNINNYPNKNPLKNKNNNIHFLRKSQSTGKLPQISVTKLNKYQIVKNKHRELPLKDQSLNHNLSSPQQNINHNHKFTNSCQVVLNNESVIEALTKKMNNDLQIKQNNKISKKSQTSKPKAKKQMRVTPLQIRKQRFQKTVFGLAKNQRFFEEDEVVVPQQAIEKLGLYEATNIYKYANVKKLLDKGYQDKLKPVINLKFATFTLCSKNQFFLTSNAFITDNREEDYLISKSADPSKCHETPSNQQNSVVKIQVKKKLNDAIIQKIYQQVEPKQTHIINEPFQQPLSWMLSIDNYCIIKNEQYFALKTKCIQDWSQINFILHMIVQYLKKVKISLLSFKFQKQTFMKEIWSCKKIQNKVLEKLLKLRPNNKEKSEKFAQVKQNCKFSCKEEVIREVVRLWKDRQTLKLMKTHKNKREEVLLWMCLRMLAKRKIKLAKQRALARTEFLNIKLKTGEWDYQIQIHIPSYSQLEEVRNTTQYMECYENMFYHMWKCSNKHFILILPAINEVLLQLLQEKIKISKNITLICPESHQQYPKSLPLSACLLYCKEGLAKIKRILDGKKGVIIPGRCSHTSFIYEYYLSELLNCPIYSTLHAPTLFTEVKDIWNRHQVPTATYKVVQPRSSIQDAIDKLAQLISENKDIKTWVFKINEEFNGRGIATFDTQSSKKLKQIILSENDYLKEDKTQKIENNCAKTIKQDIKQLIIQYLKTHFRLKLKVNFQNCVLRVQEYIQKLLIKGGIIEQYLEQCETYEFCYNIQPTCLDFSNLYLLDDLQEQKYESYCQNYQVQFMTKLSVFNSKRNQLPPSLKDFSKKTFKILRQEKYFGFVTATVLFDPKNSSIYAIQIKPYMTLNSSMGYFLKIFNKKEPLNKRQVASRRNANIVNGRIDSQWTIRRELSTNRESQLIYVFIPFIIFTDVDEVTRSEIIQHLVLSSWQKDSNQLFNPLTLIESTARLYGTLYLSLGLSLGLMAYGTYSQLKQMKKEAVGMLREISQKIQSIKLYKGTQEVRDIFQFGDLIRAVSKIQ